MSAATRRKRQRACCSKPRAFSLQLLVCFLAVVIRARTEDNIQVCDLIDACELCDATDMQNIDACKETGKIESFVCHDADKAVEMKDLKEYRSCQRTVADEESLMIQLQTFCLLAGSLAYLSVRKQKLATSSLFDQRKRRGTVEMETLSKEEEENVPLTSAINGTLSPARGLDIV